VITQVTQRAWLALLRYNPHIRGLAYQSMPYTRFLLNPANGFTSDAHAGIGDEQAQANPTWYAKNGSTLIVNPNGSGPDNLIDVGNTAVRTAWSLNSRTRALSGTGIGQKWQGVFADDTNYHLGTALMPTAYPTDASWWAAQLGMFQTIYPAYQAAGLDLVPNIGAWMQNTSSWNGVGTDLVGGILPFTDGGLDEFFTMFAGADLWSGYYHYDLGALERTVALGKRFYAQAQGSSANALYALATLMIGAHATNPSLQSFGFSGIQDYVNEYWIPEFELDIGAPLYLKTEIGGNAQGFNAFQRRFERGWAVVNPKYNVDGSTRVSAVTFTLTGGLFSAPGYTNVRSVTLDPGRGAVLSLSVPGV
jgi:hypothetical protein